MPKIVPRGDDRVKGNPGAPGISARRLNATADALATREQRQVTIDVGVEGVGLVVARRRRVPPDGAQEMFVIRRRCLRDHLADLVLRPAGPACGLTEPCEDD